MIIESMELKNFRNYRELQLHFDAKTNIFYGDNAQGKTNILEAVYLSGTTKSHKGSRDRDMILFGEDEGHLRTFVKKGEIEYQIDIHLKKNKTKGIAINGVPIRKASELFGIANFVFFSPEDLSIIKQGPGSAADSWIWSYVNLIKYIFTIWSTTTASWCSAISS